MAAETGRRRRREQLREEEIVTDAGASAGRESAVSGVDRRDGAVVASLAGELDLYNAEEIRASLLEALADEPESLVVDLEEVRFIDSTALGVLIEARTRMADRNGLPSRRPRSRGAPRPRGLGARPPLPRPRHGRGGARSGSLTRCRRPHAHPQ